MKNKKYNTVGTVQNNLEVHVHLYYSIYRVHPILVVLWKIVFRTPETKHFEEN
jgi:hypothetical protein